MNSERTNLEKQFHAAMQNLCETIKAEVKGYNPSYFCQMVENKGGLATAQHLLSGRPQDVSEGFVRLVLEQRLDLSVESLVRQEKWQPLFTKEELQNAKRRLTPRKNKQMVEQPTSNPDDGIFDLELAPYLIDVPQNLSANSVRSMCNKIDSKETNKIVTEVVKKRLAPTKILEVSTKSDVDYEGDLIMRVSIVFDDSEHELDPNKTLGLIRVIQDRMSLDGIEAFPLPRYMTPEEKQELDKHVESVN